MKRHNPPKGRRRRQGRNGSWDQFFSEEEQNLLTEEDRQEAIKKKLGERSLADAGLSVRTVNTLEEEGIFLVNQLAQKTREELLGISNFGATALEECCRLMQELKLSHPDWTRPRKSKSSRKKK